MEEAEVRKKAAESENKKMFRSRFDIFVLNALEDKDGASYGYDVINYIQNRTKGHYKIKTFSTIYNTLKRLEEQNFVVSGAGDGETNGAARVYYTLTPEGRKYLEDNKQEYKYLRTLLDNLLTDEDFDLDNEEAPYKAGDLKPFTKRNRQDGHAYSSDDNSGDIEDINERFDLDIPNEDFQTIGGYVFGLLGREPEVNDVIEDKNITYKVLELDGRRISRITMHKETPFVDATEQENETEENSNELN